MQEARPADGEPQQRKSESCYSPLVTALSSNRTVTKKNRSEGKRRGSRDTAPEYSTEDAMNR